MRLGVLFVVAACGKVNDPPRTLTVLRDGTAVDAVTITSDVGGINCGATCSADFKFGAMVTLSAQPVGGARWSGGGCSGTASCTVKLDQAITVMATTCDSTPLAFDTTGAIVMAPMPAGCTTATIDAAGAQGGGAMGGKGAELTGTVPIDDGESLKILVGAVGTGGLTNCSAAGYGAGGGGGSFVTRMDNTPLVIAAGGGGAGLNGDVGTPGSTSMTGDSIQSAVGGSNGNGGAIGVPDTGGCGFRGSGGGGLLADGGVGANGGGIAFVNGGAGGIDPMGGTNDCCMQAVGGFGGGGAGGNGGGGGGGYSGGAGGSNGGMPVTYPGGGGGGSFNAGTNETAMSGVRTGSGHIAITPKL